MLFIGGLLEEGEIDDRADGAAEDDHQSNRDNQGEWAGMAVFRGNDAGAVAVVAADFGFFFAKFFGFDAS